MNVTSQNKTIMDHASQIASGYFSNNTVAQDDIESVIKTIYKSLENLQNDKPVLGERPLPAVPIKKSVTPDYIICLEDGKKLKMLKRYLKTTYNMTPDNYRERWGLARDYPMVAPNYAERRSQLAKDIGLGKKRKA